jgi:transposase
VILVPPGVRILLAVQPVDFRKGMDGLAALVQQVLRADPFAGDVFIFRPRRASRAPFSIPLAIRQDRVSVASALRPAAARLPAIGSGRERRPLG